MLLFGYTMSKHLHATPTIPRKCTRAPLHKFDTLNPVVSLPLRPLMAQYAYGMVFLANVYETLKTHIMAQQYPVYGCYKMNALCSQLAWIQQCDYGIFQMAKRSLNIEVTVNILKCYRYGYHSPDPYIPTQCCIYSPPLAITMIMS